MNSKNLVIVHHGTHRGMWVRNEADRDRAWNIMSSWTPAFRAIAKDYPVRVALDDEGWAYVRERALGDGLAAAMFKGLAKQLAAPVDPDELPSFPSDDDPKPARPQAPWGQVAPFRSQARHLSDGSIAIQEICADGQTVILGSG